jgi:acyl-CoA synthetase (NDP forming)
VVGNSTAIGVLAADAALSQGLVLAHDPVDVGAQDGPEAFAAAVRDALQRKDVDSLIVVFLPPLMIPGTAYARALRAAVSGLAEERAKPIVSTFLAVEGVPAELAVAGPGGAPGRGSIPSYPSPERAVQALATATRYARWRAAPQGVLRRPVEVDRVAATEIVTAALSGVDGEVELPNEQVTALLAAYGIDIVAYRVVADADAAVLAADELGYPVTVKAADPKFWRRTDLVGLRLDLPTPEAVHGAHAELRTVSDVDQMYVQRMAPKGIACAIGLQEDPSFGTLVSFGLSGVISDLVGDRAYRAIPLTDADAASLIRAPRTAPLLTGYGGTEPADLDALADLVLRVAALAEDLPEVRWLSLEPILVSAHGSHVTGGRAVLATPLSTRDTGPRRLRSAPGAG